MAGQHLLRTDMHLVLMCLASSTHGPPVLRCVCKASRDAFDARLKVLSVSQPEHGDTVLYDGAMMPKLLARATQLHTIKLAPGYGSDSSCSPLLHQLTQAAAAGLLPRLQVLLLDRFETCTSLPPTGTSLLGCLRHLSLRCDRLACSLLPLSGCSQLSRLELEGLTGNASGTLGHALPMLTCLLDLRLSFSAELRTSELLASLCHVFSLQTLHLAFVPPLPDPAVLASSLRHLQGLTHLELACAHARAYNLDAIAPALPSLVNLQELVLESLQWSEVLLEGLSALPALRMLDLRNGNHPLPDGSAEQDPRLPHSSCAALLRALSGPLRSRLRKLTLYNMVPYMSPLEAVAQLGVALGSLPHLEVLYAWTAPDEYECAEQAPAVFAALAPGLACAPLRELQLGCSRMNERGLQALAECIALEGCPLRSTLRTLSLAEAFYELRDDEQQPATPRFCRALTELLSTLPGLTSLDLSDNHLGPQGMVAIAPALAQMRGLRRLGLASTFIGQQGGAALQHALAGPGVVKVHLRALAASHCDGWAPPLAMLQRLPLLERVDCGNYDSGQQVDEGLVREIRGALPGVRVTVCQANNLYMLD